MGLIVLSLVERLFLSQRVPYQRFHCNLLVQVCDEPHPLLIKVMLNHCVSTDIDNAYLILKSLWDKGYSPHDIITNIFRVCKTQAMPEYLKLEFIKVRGRGESKEGEKSGENQ